MDRVKRGILHSVCLASLSATFPSAGKSAMNSGDEGELEVPPELIALWKLTGGDPTTSDAAVLAFEDAGLILVTPPKRYGYPSTPLNSVTFAHTGGDGVHYGWLAIDGIKASDSPIVMTVPMAADEQQNIVVGSSFLDFLHLGCRDGYFALDQLAYDWDGTVRELELGTVVPDAWPEKRRQLNLLSAHFDLSPWANPGSRLRGLQERLARLLQLPSTTGNTLL